MLYRAIVFSLSYLLIVSCSHKSNLHSKLSKEDRKHIQYKGTYKVGKPYTIRGVNYVPKEDVKYDQTGFASWYGKKDKFHGKKTANGDVYNSNTLTAAHPSLPMPSLVKVTELASNKAVILMINDRGPFESKRLKRIIDISEKAAELLKIKNKGIAKVRVQYLAKETDKFRQQINLKKAIATKGVKSSCSVNCQVKLVNMKYNLNID